MLIEVQICKKKMFCYTSEHLIMLILAISLRLYRSLITCKIKLPSSLLLTIVFQELLKKIKLVLLGDSWRERNTQSTYKFARMLILFLAFSFKNADSNTYKKYVRLSMEAGEIADMHTMCTWNIHITLLH